MQPDMGAAINACELQGIALSSLAPRPSLPPSLPMRAPHMQHLPEDVKRRYEDPASRYNFGWSQGKETLEGGQPDTRKGSYYGNPLRDDAAGGDAELARRFPCYCRPNLWPQQELPQLEAAFKALGQLIIQVGLLLMRHADKFVAARGGHPQRLHTILAQSPCPKGARPQGPNTCTCVLCAHDVCACAGGPSLAACWNLLCKQACIGSSTEWALPTQPGDAVHVQLLHATVSVHAGRLLHYFPSDPDAPPSSSSGQQQWCGWHYDHGSLTGLTSAMHLDARGHPASCPDSQAGLHIKDRAGGCGQGLGESMCDFSRRSSCSSCIPNDLYAMHALHVQEQVSAEPAA